MNKKGISNVLSYIALTMVILSIGSFIAYFFIYQTKITSKVITSELEKEEGKILERISLIYWGPDYCILSNDGEIKVIIKKIYVDNNIIDKSNDLIIINPHDKKEVLIPYGKNLMIETLSGNLFKFTKKEFTTIEGTWIENLLSEVTSSFTSTILTSTYTITKTITLYVTTTMNYTHTQKIGKDTTTIFINLESMKNTFLIVLCFTISPLKFKMNNKKHMKNSLKRFLYNKYGISMILIPIIVIVVTMFFISFLSIGIVFSKIQEKAEIMQHTMKNEKVKENLEIYIYNGSITKDGWKNSSNTNILIVNNSGCDIIIDYFYIISRDGKLLVKGLMNLKIEKGDKKNIDVKKIGLPEYMKDWNIFKKYIGLIVFHTINGNLFISKYEIPHLEFN